MGRRLKIAAGALAVLFSSTGVAWAYQGLDNAQGYYAANLYMGTQWSTSGTYGDGVSYTVPSSAAGNGDPGDLVVNNSEDTYGGSNPTSDPNFPEPPGQWQYLLFQGAMPSTATMTINLYGYGSNLDYSYITSLSITSAQIGKNIDIASYGAHAFDYTITDSGTSTMGGNVWLHTATGTDDEYATQWEFQTPPWGTAVPTYPSSGGTSSPATVAVSNFPAPPDWSAITTEIAQKVWGSVPPIPAPPAATESVTSPVILDPPPVAVAPLSAAGTAGLSAPGLTGIPTAPPDTLPPWSGFDLTTGYASISVPTTGSQAFSIPDPGDLPHQAAGVAPIPGSVGSVGFLPTAPGLVAPSPVPSAPPPVPTSGGPIPSAVVPGSGGPVPNLPGIQDTVPTPSGPGTVPPYGPGSGSWAYPLSVPPSTAPLFTWGG